MLTSGVTLSIIAFSSIVAVNTADIRTEQKLFVPKLRDNCSSIKCPPTANPVCVKFKMNSNRSIYIQMLNKCEMNYMGCHKVNRANAKADVEPKHKPSISVNNEMKTQKSFPDDGNKKFEIDYYTGVRSYDNVLDTNNNTALSDDEESGDKLGDDNDIDDFDNNSKHDSEIVKDSDKDGEQPKGVDENDVEVNQVMNSGRETTSKEKLDDSVLPNDASEDERENGKDISDHDEANHSCSKDMVNHGKHDETDDNPPSDSSIERDDIEDVSDHEDEDKSCSKEADNPENNKEDSEDRSATTDQDEADHSYSKDNSIAHDSGPKSDAGEVEHEDRADLSDHDETDPSLFKKVTNHGSNESHDKPLTDNSEQHTDRTKANEYDVNYNWSNDATNRGGAGKTELDNNDKQIKEEKDEYSLDCPTICPSRSVMVCAKCQHGVYRTFMTMCHMRMFACKHNDEELDLVSRSACVLSAPFLTSSPDMKLEPRELITGKEVDPVLRYIYCREEGKLEADEPGRPKSDDPRCNIFDRDTQLLPQKYLLYDYQ